jgi:phosphatidylserine/phosphatidylglycerophosphate/cardiolipin synthase-like enzyme
MSIDLKVYDNGDHTCLVWLPTDAKPIPECRGFAIERTRAGKTDYLHGFVGFSDKDTPDQAWKFPVQRYMWWDYDVQPGDSVQYRVLPAIGSDQSNLTLAEDLASPMTPILSITGQSTGHLSSYFNRGIVAAQWVTRAMSTAPKGSNIKKIISTLGNPLRNELSGLLRPEILSLLEDAKKQNCKIYAALYELNDPELIAALETFGEDCNLILANGAFKPPDNDENKAIRATLKTKIRVYDRLVPQGHFAHNKFVVVCDADRKPLQVLTGSTNWTITGLCTQANNGLIIDDPAVAQDFLDAWDRYQAAGSAYPPTLAAADSKSNSYQVDGCKITPWFVPTQHAEDLDYARKLINAAKDGILFLFFNPGTFQPDDEPEKWTLLQNVLNRHHEDNNAAYNPNLYIKGVVNQEIPYLTEDNVPAKGKKPPAASMDPTTPAHSIALYNSGIEPPVRLGHDVMVPANIKNNFSKWETELLGAGVHVHSKVIVLDPFGANPVVMTGSHNLGFKASSKNDDNLVIIEGNAPLAAAYAVNIIAIFQSYRWNSSVEAHRQDPKFWHGLEDNDTWQTGHLTGDSLAELQFWFGNEQAEAEAQPLTIAASAGSSSPSGSSSASGSSSVSSSSGATGTSSATGTAAHSVHTIASRTRHRVNAVSTKSHHAAATHGKGKGHVQSIREHARPGRKAKSPSRATHAHTTHTTHTAHTHTTHVKHPRRKSGT